MGQSHVKTLRSVIRRLKYFEPESLITNRRVETTHLVPESSVMDLYWKAVACPIVSLLRWFLLIL